MPLPGKLPYLKEHHNIIHANFIGMGSKDDMQVYMKAKSLKRILITFDSDFYYNKKFKLFDDVGLIYLVGTSENYSMFPNEIEERIKKLLKTGICKADCFCSKIKLTSETAEIKTRAGIKRIRLTK